MKFVQFNWYNTYERFRFFAVFHCLGVRLCHEIFMQYDRDRIYNYTFWIRCGSVDALAPVIRSLSFQDGEEKKRKYRHDEHEDGSATPCDGNNPSMPTG